MTRRLFVFGVGYSGIEIAMIARASGWSVGGTCTTQEKAARLRSHGIDAHVFDGTTGLAPEAIGTASHILCTIAPGAGGDPAIRTCSDSIGRARWLGYLSTTGIYGDRGGEWVDETTVPQPTQARSIERLAAEQAWQDLATASGVPLDIFRLPGIYGPGRSAIDQVKAGTARRIDKPGQFFSRIHVADIAAAVMAALQRERPGGNDCGIYNVVDDLPAPNSEVVAFAFGLLGKPVPPAIPWEEAREAMSEMARSFYAESRRVRNERLKRELGVTLRYPSYREGLSAIANAGTASAG